MNELGLYAGSMDLRRADLRDIGDDKGYAEGTSQIPNFQYHHGNDEIHI